MFPFHCRQEGMRNKVVISIGSNINPDRNIAYALDLLTEVMDVKTQSPLVETQPIGITNQPKFKNGAVLGYTHLSLKELNAQLKLIEDKTGRDRSRPKFGPREIDLDITLWNDEVVDNDYYTRDFLQKLVQWIDQNKENGTSNESNPLL